MRAGSRHLAAAFATGGLALLSLSGSATLASGGSLPPRTAAAEVAGERAFLFTTRFCEPGRCLDAAVGVTRAGRADLPVIVAAPGDTIAFEVAFAPASLRLTARAPGFERTATLGTATWRLPEELPLPASLELEAANQTSAATFLAVVDRSAPGPTVDQARVRLLPSRTRAPLLDLRFRLCSQQTGAVEFRLSERRGGRTRQVERVLPRVHMPGCSTYRSEQRSQWVGRSKPGRFALRARVGNSQLGPARSVRLTR